MFLIEVAVSEFQGWNNSIPKIVEHFILKAIFFSNNAINT